MQFGLDKYVKITFTKSSLVTSRNFPLDVKTEITELEYNKTYNYLWINKKKCMNNTTFNSKKKKRILSDNKRCIRNRTERNNS